MARLARLARNAANGDGYTGMLITACVAMTMGVLALALEANEYGWEQKAPATPKANIPAMPKGLASIDLPSPLITVEAPKLSEPATPAVNLPTAPAVTVAPSAQPSKPEVATKPVEAPATAGPIPSPLVLPGRTAPSAVTPTSSPSEPETSPKAPAGPTPSPIGLRPRGR